MAASIDEERDGLVTKWLTEEDCRVAAGLLIFRHGNKAAAFADARAKEYATLGKVSEGHAIWMCVHRWVKRLAPAQESWQ